MASTNTKLQACKATRVLAARSLCASLEDLRQHNEPISEVALRDKWLAIVRKHPSVFCDGWYTPPPHGIGMLFGTESRNSRHNHESLRSEKNWPQAHVVLDDQHPLLYGYASFVERTTGMLGDFGITLYFGNEPVIKNHLRRCLLLNKEIFDFIVAGKSFAEVYEFASERFSYYGLTNHVASSTDPAGVNIGHTVPASDADWTAEEAHLLQAGDEAWDEVKNMISTRRTFVSHLEQITYQPGMAVTLEPRLVAIDDPNIPMGSYHTIVFIQSDGTKELLMNFEELFRASGMEYMLDISQPFS
jgi:hypothetical protein